MYNSQRIMQDLTYLYVYCTYDMCHIKYSLKDKCDNYNNA